VRKRNRGAHGAEIRTRPDLRVLLTERDYGEARGAKQKWNGRSPCFSRLFAPPPPETLFRLASTEIPPPLPDRAQRRAEGEGRNKKERKKEKKGREGVPDRCRHGREGAR